MLNEYLDLFGALLPFCGSLTYAYATWRGKAAPNRVSWSLWALNPIIVGIAEVAKGSGLGSAFAFAAGIGPAVVLVASLHTPAASWKIAPFDIACGICSVLALVLWGLTRDADIAIVLNIIADFIAAVPTILKAMSHPLTENAWAFGLSALGALIVLLTVSRWDIANVAFQLYALVICVLLGVIIALGRRRANAAPAPPGAAA